MNKYKSKYIKNGKVDNVDKLISYLNKIIKDINVIKKTFIFILDNNLNNSEIFTYKYVISKLNLLDYKIKYDLDFIENIITDNNIIVFSWSGSTTYVYLNDNELLSYPFNIKKINSLKKEFIILIGDTPLSKNINLPIYEPEYNELNIFNYIGK